MLKVFSFAVLLTLVLTSCVSVLTPLEMNHRLPTLTTSRYLLPLQAEELVKAGKGKYLVKDRSYHAPPRLSVQGDLKFGAKGIDDWVKLDGGNAYVLKNYKWLTINNGGTTQLQLDFDTFQCN